MQNMEPLRISTFFVAVDETAQGCLRTLTITCGAIPCLRAKSFDMYTSSKDYPLQVDQEYPNNGKDWTVRTKVDATNKLLRVDRQRRIQTGEKGSSITCF
jgi:hypothetical protein